jgi:hypothetical protein
VKRTDHGSDDGDLQWHTKVQSKASNKSSTKSAAVDCLMYFIFCSLRYIDHLYHLEQGPKLVVLTFGWHYHVYSNHHHRESYSQNLDPSFLHLKVNFDFVNSFYHETDPPIGSYFRLFIYFYHGYFSLFCEIHLV